MRDLHHIQREILISLSRQSPQRFSQLQPASISNNVFSYHLKRLLDTGYITVSQGGYIPARKALKNLQYTGHLPQKKTTPVLLTAILVQQKSSGHTLLFQRQADPFMDWFSVPSGIIHSDETVYDAARRELYEKTGIETSDLDYVGVLDFRYLDESSHDMFVHAIAFVYTLIWDAPLPLPVNPRFSIPQWSDLKHEDILPEVFNMIAMTEKRPTSPVSVDLVEPPKHRETIAVPRLMNAS